MYNFELTGGMVGYTFANVTFSNKPEDINKADYYFYQKDNDTKKYLLDFSKSCEIFNIYKNKINQKNFEGVYFYILDHEEYSSLFKNINYIEDKEYEAMFI